YNFRLQDVEWVREHLCLNCFLSNRRRHTRWPRDGSSDVCTSALVLSLEATTLVALLFVAASSDMNAPGGMVLSFLSCRSNERTKIGRASCRERVEIMVVA